MAAQSSAALLSQTKSWPVARYARYISAPTEVNASDDACTSTNPSKSSGYWKHIDSNDLMLILMESKNMVLSSGNTIHENYSLHNASDWMRGICKGDSVLFACRIQNEIRRFRIQFKKTSHKSAVENCQECSQVLATYFRVKNVSTNMEDSQQEDTRKESDLGETSHLRGEASLQDIARAVSNPDVNRLPLAYQYNNIQMPADRMKDFLKLCLTDANFPGFVGSVEKELKGIISDS